MIWPAMLFNLCVGLLLAGYLLRAVRRFERTADRIEAKMDVAFDVQMRKYDAACVEIKGAMRATLDAAIRVPNCDGAIADPTASGADRGFDSGSTMMIGELEPLDVLVRRNPVRYEVILARVRNLDAEAANAVPADEVLKSLGVRW